MIHETKLWRKHLKCLSERLSIVEEQRKSVVLSDHRIIGKVYSESPACTYTMVLDEATRWMTQRKKLEARGSKMA